MLIDDLADLHARAQMVGWDFSRLDGRMRADDPPWDFETDCANALASVSVAVDLGTGGGERLIRLIERASHSDHWVRIVATEGWEPNVDIARDRLAAHGVEVVRYDAEAGDAMPFGNTSVDLVMARHESVDAAEVARVLSPGGVLLTQQVHGLDAHELREWFGGDGQYPDVTLDRMTDDLRRAGLRIDVAEEWSGSMVFDDTRALVEYMALVPWDVPDFDPTAHADRLADLERTKPITATQRRFRLYASKPGLDG